MHFQYLYKSFTINNFSPTLPAQNIYPQKCLDFRASYGTLGWPEGVVY